MSSIQTVSAETPKRYTATGYRIETAVAIRKIVGSVLTQQTRHSYPRTPRTQRHRAVVATARAGAIDAGFHDNPFIHDVLASYKIPHASQSLAGTISHENHPGLASTIGNLYKGIRHLDISRGEGHDIIRQFGRSIDTLTPDATDRDRQAILIGALGKVNIAAEYTNTLDTTGHPLFSIAGQELAVPFTANDPAYEEMPWISPYVSLDFTT